MKGLNIWAYVMLIGMLISAGGFIYKMIGDAKVNQIALAKERATVDQLKKDAKSVVELEARNIDLQKRIDHAKTIYSKVKDPDGCFRAPVPNTAAVELRNLYDSITSRARSLPLQ